MATTEQIRPGDYADVMPAMSDEEFAALKRSIDEDGLKHPIEVTDDGVIVDGHHRFRACRELGIEPETTVVEDVGVENAIRANLTRRNLNDGTVGEVVQEYLEEHYDGERTQEEVAEDLGVGQATVSRAWKEIDGGYVSREEKRQQAADYLARNPDASNREVARNVEADVSHTAVRNWREEWETPDDEDDPEEDDAADETPTEESGAGGDWPRTFDVRVWSRAGGKKVAVDGDVPEITIEQYPNEKQSDSPRITFLQDLASTVGQAVGVTLDGLEPGDRVGTVTFARDGGWIFETLEGLAPEETAQSQGETPDSSEEPAATADESSPDDAQDEDGEKPDTDDPAPSQHPHPSEEADTPLQQALVKVDQLKAEKEELEGKLLEVAEIRTNASKAKSAVDAARRHLDGKDPSIESADGELEHAQSVLEGIADGE